MSKEMTLGNFFTPRLASCSPFVFTLAPGNFVVRGGSGRVSDEVPGVRAADLSSAVRACLYPLCVDAVTGRR